MWRTEGGKRLQLLLKQGRACARTPPVPVSLGMDVILLVVNSSPVTAKAASAPLGESNWVTIAMSH